MKWLTSHIFSYGCLFVIRIDLSMSIILIYTIHFLLTTHEWAIHSIVNFLNNKSSKNYHIIHFYLFDIVCLTDNEWLAVNEQNKNRKIYLFQTIQRYNDVFNKVTCTKLPCSFSFTFFFLLFLLCRTFVHSIFLSLFFSTFTTCICNSVMI